MSIERMRTDSVFKTMMIDGGTTRDMVERLIRSAGMERHVSIGRQSVFIIAPSEDGRDPGTEAYEGDWLVASGALDKVFVVDSAAVARAFEPTHPITMPHAVNGWALSRIASSKLTTHYRVVKACWSELVHSTVTLVCEGFDRKATTFLADEKELRLDYTGARVGIHMIDDRVIGATVEDDELIEEGRMK